METKFTANFKRKLEYLLLESKSVLKECDYNDDDYSDDYKDHCIRRNIYSALIKAIEDSK